MLERNGAALLDHDARVAAEGRDPVAELLRVRDRGGERDHAHRRGQVDQHLLPDGAAVRVLEVVDLVHHDREQPRERRRPLVEHVAEHLGGHDDHRRLRVDRVVAREQPDAAGAVLGDEVAELLVRQRLQRGRVEGLAAAVERPLDRELGDDRLAGAGRRRDEHRHPRSHGVDGITLEPVQLEGELLREIVGVVTVRPVYGRACPSPSTPLRRRARGRARQHAAERRRRRRPVPRGSTGGRRPRSGGAPRPARPSAMPAVTSGGISAVGRAGDHEGGHVDRRRGPAPSPAARPSRARRPRSRRGSARRSSPSRAPRSSRGASSRSSGGGCLDEEAVSFGPQALGERPPRGRAFRGVGLGPRVREHQGRDARPRGPPELEGDVATHRSPQTTAVSTPASSSAHSARSAARPS